MLEVSQFAWKAAVLSERRIRWFDRKKKSHQAYDETEKKNTEMKREGKNDKNI